MNYNNEYKRWLQSDALTEAEKMSLSLSKTMKRPKLFALPSLWDSELPVCALQCIWESDA